MKLIIDKLQILNVLSKIQGLTSRRSNLSITENILIRSFNQGVSISATDLETVFEGFYPANVAKEGTVAVSSKKLFEIIREFPSDEIIIQEIDNRWIEISNDTIQYHIVGMNPDDFPETARIDDIHFITIKSAVLEKMIDQTTIISPAGDEKRPHFNGVFVEIMVENEKNRIRFVSTDGSRLNKSDYFFGVNDIYIESYSVLVPKKGLNEVSKFLDFEGDVQIGIKENHFIFKKENETLIIRLLEGEFPNYSGILEKGGSQKIQMEKIEFLKMLKRMSIMASDSYKGAVFKFDEDKLVVTATNPQFGESKEETAIEFSGESFEVAFNPRFFIDTLSVLDDQNVVINILDSSHPCIVEGEIDDSFISIIMPMRM